MRDESIMDHNKASMLLGVIRKNLLPNVQYESFTAWGGEETIKSTSVSLKLSYNHSIFRKSYLDVSIPSGLIHFTTVDTLIKILESKRIRLSSLNGVDDLHEYNYARRILHNTEFERSFTSAKRNIFSLSMCSETVETKEKSLNMWRKYADDGLGVGIVFKLYNANRWKWYKFHLSKIFYGEKPLLRLKSFQAAYEKFQNDNDFSCSNLGEALSTIFPFHKAPIYSEEQEYRLIYTHERNRGVIKPKEDFGADKRYLELELEKEIIPPKEIRKKFKEMFGHYESTIYQPKISITKIYFGYRMNEKERYELTKRVLKYLEAFETQPQLVTSHLTKYFQ